MPSVPAGLVFASGVPPTERRKRVMSHPTDSRIVGRVPSADGVSRDVCEDADGRQWVVGGYDGERVYGVWLPPADEPVAVARAGAPG
jgi:hypothetical protein